MQISSISNSQQNLGFKSVYPVYYWLTEDGVKYTAARTEELTRKLNGKIVRTLNNPKNKPRYDFAKEIYTSVNKLVEYIANKDNGFGSNSVARSFYNRNGGLKPNKFEPFAYIITSSDVAAFNKEYGMPIGREIREAPIVGEKPESAELTMALGDYVTKGLNFVKKGSKEFEQGGVPFGLHIKMRHVRTKTGSTKGFDLIDWKFCPEKGKENPFVRTGYIK